MGPIFLSCSIVTIKNYVIACCGYCHYAFFFCYDRVMIILIVLFYMVIYSILICSAHGYFKSLCPTREFNLFEFILLFVCLSLFFKRNSNYFHIRCQQTPTIVKKGATPLSVSDIISF